MDKQLKMFLTVTNHSIVGQEISAKNGKRTLKGAAYLEMHPSGTRFNFSAIRFFEPEGEFVLHETALIGEQDLAPMIAERFKLYLAQLETTAEQRKKEE